MAKSSSAERTILRTQTACKHSGFEENEAVVHGCDVSCVDVCRRAMWKKLTVLIYLS